MRHLALIFSLLSTAAFGATNSKLYRTVAVTPTLDTSAYASGDRMGSIMTIPAAFKSDGTVLLQSLSVVDAADQGAAFTILLFSQLPTIASADNAAIDFSDANALFYIGHVAVATGDYVNAASNQVATVRNIGLALKSTDVTSGTTAKTGKIYAVLVSGGSPTYAASSLQLTFSFEE